MYPIVFILFILIWIKYPTYISFQYLLPVHDKMIDIWPTLLFIGTSVDLSVQTVELLLLSFPLVTPLQPRTEIGSNIFMHDITFFSIFSLDSAKLFLYTLSAFWNCYWHVGIPLATTYVGKQPFKICIYKPALI